MAQNDNVLKRYRRGTPHDLGRFLRQGKGTRRREMKKKILDIYRMPI